MSETNSRSDADWRTDPVPLEIGPLTATYHDGELRDVRLDGHLILTRLYAAIRDENWKTIPGVVRRTRRMSGTEFVERVPEVFFESEHAFDSEPGDDNCDFFWAGSIRGHGLGAGMELSFLFVGGARTNFRRNRIGFCLLHPASAAGDTVIAELADGRRIDASFPTLIDPNQPVAPFTELRALEHILPTGAVVRYEFEGDEFEMEDQRNWTDASFKTFCTPLARPFPVEVRAHERIVQRVTIRPREGGRRYRPPRIKMGVESVSQSAPAPMNMGVVTVSFLADEDPSGHGAPTRVRVGAQQAMTRCATSRSDIVREAVLTPTFMWAGASTPFHASVPLGDEERARLAALKLAHLRVDLLPGRASAEQSLHDACALAALLDCPLEIALLLEPGEDARRLSKLAQLLASSGAKVARVLALPAIQRTTVAPDYLALIGLARDAFGRFDAPVFAGTDSDFFFVNRFPPPMDSCDGLAFAINPQVHAFDDASIEETLLSYPAVLATAQNLSGGKPVIVSPLTLLPRWNPYAAVAPSRHDEPPIDGRESTPFFAEWLFRAVDALARASAHSVTVGETHGPRGLLGTPVETWLRARKTPAR